MGQIVTSVIPFLASEDKSAAELGGAAPTMANVVADSAGVLRRRPGISAWTPFSASFASGSPVIGMISYGTSTLVYATEDRKIHSITTAGGLTELSSSDLATQLDGSGRPSMVGGKTLLAMAGGGAIQKWTGLGVTARLTNTGTGGDPPAAGSICALARRLVAQLVGDSGEFWWSGPLDDWENWEFTTTGGANGTQMSAKPDGLLAIRDNTNEVFGFGPETIQVYSPAALQIDPNDENNLLDFATTRTLAVGTLSPYSIIQVDDLFAFLDRRRRIILSDARTMKVISKPVSTTLHELTRVDDVWGFRMRFGRHDCLVWFFPTDNIGLIWDSESGRWSEWREGGVGTDTISITSAYNWEEEGVFLVGLSDGSIAQLDAGSTTDLTKNIAIDLVSGFSRGSALKACRGVKFAFKRTWAELPAPTNGLTASGHVRISYRDNLGVWKILKDVELSTDPCPVVSIRSVGTYRTRQWRVQFTGQDELQLVSAEEELEILEA